MNALVGDEATLREEAGKLDYPSGDTHYNRACAALQKKYFVTAANEALASVKCESPSPRAHLLAGMALLRLGMLVWAEEMLLEAVVRDPEFAPAHFHLAEYYQKHRRDLFLYGRHRTIALQLSQAG